MEENLEAILEKINTSVEERVNAAIETGIARIAQQYRQVNQAKTTATTDLKAQVSDIKSTVAQLRSQLSSLSSDISACDGDSAKTDTHGSRKRSNHTPTPQTTLRRKTRDSRKSSASPATRPTPTDMGASTQKWKKTWKRY